MASRLKDLKISTTVYTATEVDQALAQVATPDTLQAINEKINDLDTSLVGKADKENVESVAGSVASLSLRLDGKADQTSVNTSILSLSSRVSTAEQSVEALERQHEADTVSLDRRLSDVEGRVVDLSSIYRVKGNVATYEELPTEGNTVGDVYNILDTGDNYVWVDDVGGSEEPTPGWDLIGGSYTLPSASYDSIGGVRLKTYETDIDDQGRLSVTGTSVGNDVSGRPDRYFQTRADEDDKPYLFWSKRPSTGGLGTMEESVVKIKIPTAFGSEAPETMATQEWVLAQGFDEAPTVSWDNISDVPSSFTPSAHGHSSLSRTTTCGDSLQIDLYTEPCGAAASILVAYNCFGCKFLRLPVSQEDLTGSAECGNTYGTLATQEWVQANSSSTDLTTLAPIAIGNNGVHDGTTAIAIGCGATAAGNGVALGLGAVSGGSAVAIGENAYASSGTLVVSAHEPSNCSYMDLILDAQNETLSFGSGGERVVIPYCAFKSMLLKYGGTSIYG